MNGENPGHDDLLQGERLKVVRIKKISFGKMIHPETLIFGTTRNNNTSCRNQEYTEL